MPWGDGTGPSGFGPQMGRRRGACRRFTRIGGEFVPRRAKLVGSLLPVVVALIRDLINCNGVLRTLGRKLPPHKSAQQGRRIDASYTILDEKGK